MAAAHMAPRESMLPGMLFIQNTIYSAPRATKKPASFAAGFKFVVHVVRSARGGDSARGACAVPIIQSSQGNKNSSRIHGWSQIRRLGKGLFICLMLLQIRPDQIQRRCPDSFRGKIIMRILCQIPGLFIFLKCLRQYER